MKGTAKLNVFENHLHTIDGELRSSPESRHGVNPATSEILPDVPVATQQDVDDSIQAARRVFGVWSKRPFEERKDAVEKFASAIEQLSDDFERMLTLEQGKPVMSTQMEAEMAASSNKP